MMPECLKQQTAFLKVEELDWHLSLMLHRAFSRLSQNFTKRDLSLVLYTAAAEEVSDHPEGKRSPTKKKKSKTKRPTSKRPKPSLTATLAKITSPKETPAKSPFPKQPRQFTYKPGFNCYLYMDWLNTGCIDRSSSRKSSKQTTGVQLKVYFCGMEKSGGWRSCVSHGSDVCMHIWMMAVSSWSQQRHVQGKQVVNFSEA